jgi:hypothetical protein
MCAVGSSAVGSTGSAACALKACEVDAQRLCYPTGAKVEMAKVNAIQPQIPTTLDTKAR